MVQGDRFVNKVVKEKHQKKFHFDNQEINQNHSKIINDQCKSQKFEKSQKLSKVIDL